MFCYKYRPVRDSKLQIMRSESLYCIHQTFVSAPTTRGCLYAVCTINLELFHFYCIFYCTVRGQEHNSDTIKECQQLLWLDYLTSVKIKDNCSTNSVEQNSLAIQEIPRILWNLKVHHRSCSNPPLAPSWSRSVQSTAYQLISLWSTTGRRSGGKIRHCFRNRGSFNVKNKYLFSYINAGPKKTLP